MRSNKKGWKDIKLYQLQELESLPEFDDELDLIVNQMSILKDTDTSEIEEMNITDLMNEFSEYAFLKDIPKEKQIKVISIDDRKYGMVDLSKMTLGQMVDIEEYVTDGLMKNMHKILSVLYLPIIKQNPLTKKYELDKYIPDEERENDLLNTSMDQLYPTMLFFWSIVKNFLSNSVQSSVVTLEKRMMSLKEMMNPEEEALLTYKLNQLKSLGKSGIGLE